MADSIVSAGAAPDDIIATARNSNCDNTPDAPHRAHCNHIGWWEAQGNTALLTL
jgi:hypothetical protein